MALTDYLPKRDPELDEWADNYGAKLPEVAATVDVSDDEVTGTTSRIAAFKGDLNKVNNKKAELGAAVDTKNQSKKALIDYVRPQNVRIKKHSGYNDDTGKLLKIIGPDDDFDHDAYVPTLTAEVFPGSVKLEFGKASTDGVDIDARLEGEATWTFLARDTQSPYMDNRPLAVPNQPETREYRCRAVIGDEPIGKMSEIASAVFGG